MPSKEEKQRRKALARAIEERERAGALAGLPISRKNMQLLFDHVDERLDEGCDHTLRYTREFINRHGLLEAAVIAWLHEHGGYCDCEVIANAQPDWYDLHGIN